MQGTVLPAINHWKTQETAGKPSSCHRIGCGNSTTRPENAGKLTRKAVCAVQFRSRFRSNFLRQEGVAWPVDGDGGCEFWAWLDWLSRAITAAMIAVAHNNLIRVVLELLMLVDLARMADLLSCQNRSVGFLDQPPRAVLYRSGIHRIQSAENPDLLR